MDTSDIISESDTTLILTLNMTNDFSGTNQMEAAKTNLSENEGGGWSEIGLAVPVSSQRTLTAVSADTVRFFHENIKRDLQSMLIHGIQVKIILMQYIDIALILAELEILIYLRSNLGARWPSLKEKQNLKMILSHSGTITWKMVHAKE